MLVYKFYLLGIGGKMTVFKKIYCRAFQAFFRLAYPFLPYREPLLLDSIEKVGEALKKENVSNVLLVTGNFLYGSGATKVLEGALTSAGVKYSIYSKTQPNPTSDNVEEALDIYLKNGCQAIVAFGGGSPLDCAKVVGARVACPKKPVSKFKGLLKVRRKIPTLVAIPTTAGTGSEVTLAAVITDENKHKCPISSFTLIPRYAVLDPVVTYSMPSHLTATTGMDALTHAVEAYIGHSTTKKTRALSIGAVRLIFENIELAYKEGGNRVARENMLTASYMAGVAFSRSYVGYVHAVAHSLGGKYNVPHGLANAVLLPLVLEAYGKSAHKKLYRLGVAVGVANEADTPEQGAKKFIDGIRALNENMGIPTCIKEIVKEDIPYLAKQAAKEGNPLYPVPRLMDARRLEEIYKKAAENN